MSSTCMSEYIFTDLPIFLCIQNEVNMFTGMGYYCI